MSTEKFLSTIVQHLPSDTSLGLWQQKFVKVMGIICFVAYMAVILTLFGHCTPIQKNWQIKPYAGGECSLYVHELAV